VCHSIRKHAEGETSFCGSINMGVVAGVDCQLNSQNRYRFPSGIRNGNINVPFTPKAREVAGIGATRSLSFAGHAAGFAQEDRINLLLRHLVEETPAGASLYEQPSLRNIRNQRRQMPLPSAPTLRSEQYLQKQSSEYHADRRMGIDGEIHWPCRREFWNTVRYQTINYNESLRRK